MTTTAGKHRHAARRPAGNARALLLATVLGVSLLAAACGGGGGGGGSSDPPPPPPSPGPLAADPPLVSNNVQLISPTPLATSSGGLTPLKITLGSSAVSIGIILLGTDSNLKFIEHKGLMLGGSTNITAPGGGAVPLSFNQIDWCDLSGCDPGPNLTKRDTVEEDFPDNLIDRQVEALFFPNDGTTPTLGMGTYTFQVGAADANGFLTSDTLTPYVLVKSTAPAMQTMKINLFVAEGLRPAITDAGSALADLEIDGAITFLKAVYEGEMGLVLDINVDVVPNSFVVINSQAEQDTLLKTYPLAPLNPLTRPSDRLNLYVVGSLAYLDSNIIGLSADLPGAFNFHGTILSGTLAEYQFDGTGNELGFILAHEFGHYLGLYHTSQTFNSNTEIVGHDPIGDTLECFTADLVAGGINNCLDRNNLMFPTILLDVGMIVVRPGQTTVVGLNPAIFTFP